jgi:hypothetical protein
VQRRPPEEGREASTGARGRRRRNDDRRRPWEKSASRLRVGRHPVGCRPVRRRPVRRRPVIHRSRDGRWGRGRLRCAHNGQWGWRRWGPWGQGEDGNCCADGSGGGSTGAGSPPSTGSRGGHFTSPCGDSKREGGNRTWRRSPWSGVVERQFVSEFARSRGQGGARCEPRGGLVSPRIFA